MAYLKINQNKLTKEKIILLKEICPFNAFEETNNILSINANCKMCKICTKDRFGGVIEFIQEEIIKLDKSKYTGIAVWAQIDNNKLHPVTIELLGKANELAKTLNELVYAVVTCYEQPKIIVELSYYCDKVIVINDEKCVNNDIFVVRDAFVWLFNKYRFSSILFGGTKLGRSIAPRIAAALKTGLTADCTSLQIDSEQNLLQIRPAFGGNIMATIFTPNHRPQLATVRYKTFPKPLKKRHQGEVLLENPPLSISPIKSISKTFLEKTKTDITEADVIVAVGRAFKTKQDIALVEPLLLSLNATLAGTRPLIEGGLMPDDCQIGLSGKTVKPRLIICLGISGSVHFTEGMKNSDYIISVNNDPEARIFGISDLAILSDVYEVIPALISLFEGDKYV